MNQISSTFVLLEVVKNIRKAQFQHSPRRHGTANCQQQQQQQQCEQQQVNRWQDKFVGATCDDSDCCETHRRTKVRETPPKSLRILLRCTAELALNVGACLANWQAFFNFAPKTETNKIDQDLSIIRLIELEKAMRTFLAINNLYSAS